MATSSPHRRKPSGASKAKRRLRRRFFCIVFSVVCLYSVAAFAGVLFYGINRDPAQSTTPKPSEGLRPVTEVTPEQEEEDQAFTNVAVLGCDDSGNLCDVNFVACFKHETYKIDIISVPRDSQVVMTDEMLSDMRARGRENYIPYKKGVEGLCKLTEIHSYAGDGARCQYSVAMLEEILGIDIDYYVKFTPKTFRYVVDAIGGVDFYVPMDMYWDMRDHNGPLINLKEGMQHLDGEKAEQLVRFRHDYATQDIQRIEVQHDFMMAVAEKVLSTETILNNLPSLTKTMLSYLETNITVMDALGYIKYLEHIDTSDIEMHTLTGETGNYVILDEEATKEIVDSVFRPAAQTAPANSSTDSTSSEERSATEQ